MFDTDKDQIVFIAKHKDWITIKKLLIDEHVKSEDISAAISSIQKTLFTKSFEYAEIDTEKIDDYATEIAEGTKKGINSIGMLFSSLKQPEVKKKLLDACATAKHYPLAENYFVNAVLENVGYKGYAAHDVLKKVYPDLKIAKPRGNYGKKKKKKK